jgi:hypothetical protein
MAYKKEQRIFYKRGERKDIYNTCRNAAEYVDENDVSAVAFIDRSARPMWVGFKEYWQDHHDENKPVPDMFFLDPTGFGKVNKDEYLYAADRVAEDLPGLMQYKDKTILLIDTCIHTGNTILPIRWVLRYAGFEDIRFGVINDKDNDSGVTPDITLLDHTPKLACYTFGLGSCPVKRGEAHLHSQAVELRSGERRGMKILREEIRDIVRTQTEREKLGSFGKIACKLGLK